jgi:adenylosuccinate lyase
MGRQEAHELVRLAAKDKGDFADSVLERAGGVISNDDVKAALRPESYIGSAVEQVDRVLEALGEDL